MWDQSKISSYCFVFGVNQENYKAVGVQDDPSDGNLLRQSSIYNPFKHL